MKIFRDWFQPSPHGTAREQFARLGHLVSRSHDHGTESPAGEDDAGTAIEAAGETTVERAAQAGAELPGLFDPGPPGRAGTDANDAIDASDASDASEHAHTAIGERPGDDLSAFFRNVAAGAHVHDLGDESLYLAEELAELQWSLGGRQKQALALLVLASMISVRQGSSRLPLERKTSSYLGRLVASLLSAGRLDIDPQALLRDIDKLTRAVTLDHIIGREDEYRPLIVADGCVYQHRMLWCENRLAERLRARLWADPGSRVIAHPSARAGVDQALAEVLARPAVHQGTPVALSAEQVDAVRRAISGRFTVICGGPGTGKTAIVVSMLRVLIRLGEPVESIALAAPTGKAANRMWTSIRRALEAVAEPHDLDRALLDEGAEPQTMHRLLGYVPGIDRFRHHDNNPLPVTTVIVDEASMIDLMLMERLLRALPDGARLVVLGDADQLPSVDAGAVLRDLLIAGQNVEQAGHSGFAVRLTHSYRMDPRDPAGRAILTAAGEVNAGNAAALLDEDSDSPGKLCRRAGHKDITFRGVEFFDTGGELSQVHEFVDNWYKKRIRGQHDFDRLAGKTYRYRDGRWVDEDEADLAALFAAYESSRLLTVTRRQNTGSEAINRRLHRRVLVDSPMEYNPDFYPGEPVMMRRNDYERGLFNGDQGMIVRVIEDRGPQRFRVVFPRGGTFALFHLDALRTHIELSFAMTVHKSQGSEFDEIALILPAVELPLLTRELLYTGITRARRSVVIVGAEDLLRLAIAQQGQRFSGLADKLMRVPDTGASASRPGTRSVTRNPAPGKAN